MGQVYFAREKNSPYLNVPAQGAADYSQATAKLIDDEVRQIIDQQYKTAKDVLEAHRQILEKGADLLLENEKIEGSQLEELMQEAQANGSAATASSADNGSS